MDEKRDRLTVWNVSRLRNSLSYHFNHLTFCFLLMQIYSRQAPIWLLRLWLVGRNWSLFLRCFRERKIYAGTALIKIHMSWVGSFFQTQCFWFHYPLMWDPWYSQKQVARGEPFTQPGKLLPMIGTWRKIKTAWNHSTGKLTLLNQQSVHIHSFKRSTLNGLNIELTSCLNAVASTQSRRSLGFKH